MSEPAASGPAAPGADPVARFNQWPTGRLISAAARRIERDWNAHLSGWDLNHASLPVLFLLLRGPRSQHELAQASGVTEQTMSRIVARLERSAYVDRLPHAHDRRRHDVVLTASGRAALFEAGDPQVAEEMSIRGLDPDQVEQLRGLLTVMLAQRPHASDAGLTDALDHPFAAPPGGSDADHGADHG
ncbi:MarR family winged helix-turn-helix transcriptional regulator [Cellulomonas sp. KRMCY2]|uniref:MarR family winged helix-turn-helix transcriptional regulator n=1 Tax=Cellulomonas sp. KRMCY2 TaxID=1304865 RepID=UPI001E579ADE|nr:MarR family winged helix-turn-helix transcriptional regulator [Cellulomonas sp. KRMCY2]